MNDGRLRTLSLFSGIGGIDLALRPWARTVAYCEADRWATGVLLSRMASGELDTAPVHHDVRTLDAACLRSAGIEGVNLIAGGFPCQDISTAGLGRGLAGERSGLFFEIARLAGELRPRFIFLENVAAILGRGVDAVLGALDTLGYDARWCILSAADVGAPHRRERWWCLAHATGAGREALPGQPAGSRTTGADKGKRESADSRCWDPGDVADADGQRLSPCRLPGCDIPTSDGSADASGRRPHGCAEADVPYSNRQRQSEQQDAGKPSWTVQLGRSPDAGRGSWPPEPPVGRVAHGIPRRVDRIRGLGNAVVPQAAAQAFRYLMGLEPLP